MTYLEQILFKLYKSKTVTSASFCCIQLDVCVCWITSGPAGACLWHPAEWSVHRTWQTAVSTLQSTSSNSVFRSTHKQGSSLYHCTHTVLLISSHQQCGRLREKWCDRTVR